MLSFGNTICAAQISARPKSSFLFYEKLNPYVSCRVSERVLTFRKRITELRLKSSKKPQILTTISVIVGSQTPLLQNPVLQGVPSGSISSGCITKQEVFKFIRQHRLQESGVVSHMQVWRIEKK